MNKTKVEIYQEVLRDLSQNLEGTEAFIKQRIQEIWDKKISVEEVIYFCIYIYIYIKASDFSVITCC